jgi:hypothetical protein
MTHSRCWRLLAVLLVAQGCATVREEYGSAFISSPSANESRAQDRARRAEVEWALSQMWGVARGEEQVGARLEFTFWAKGGALTLLSWRHTATGGAAGQLADEETFANSLRALLSLLTEQRTGALVFMLQRERSRWRVDYEATRVEEPPEARPRPTERTSYPTETYSAAHALAKQVTRLLQVPAGASANLRMDVMLEDDRLTGWEPGPYRATAGGTVRPADAQAAETLSLALLPFTRGMGPRTVRLELVGTHEGASTKARWRVMRAETLRPETPAPEVADVLREYRQLHAEIFRQYREEMVDSVVLAGSFTLEQVALTVMGGLIGKGLHVAFTAVAPTLIKVSTRGGTEAVRWLRTQLVRAGRKDQELLRRLWTKVETEGFESLSAMERDALAGVLRRMEQTLTKQLGPSEIKQLRKSAREDYFQNFHPDLAETLGKERVSLYEVHHRSPMEFAHLFPLLDLNGRANLVGLARPVHQSINKVWNAFRPPPGSQVTTEQVEQMVGLVDRNFGRWYDKLYDSGMSDALDTAERAALMEVSSLRNRLGRGS